MKKVEEGSDVGTKERRRLAAVVNLVEVRARRRGRKIRVLFACGGTGGHIYPALALADELSSRKPGAICWFVGSEGGMEERIVRREGYHIELLPCIKRAGKPTMHLPTLPWTAARFRKAAKRAHQILRKFMPHVIVGTGGHASAATVWAARIYNVPTLVLEQNAIPGRVNRFLSAYATEVHTQFPESKKRFSRSTTVFVSGNPVRRSIRKSVSKRSAAVTRKTVLVLGGSQGSHALNMTFAWTLRSLAGSGTRIRVLHQTGSADEELCRKALEFSGLPGEVFAYADDMAAYYASADLVVARAGATTIAELCTAGLPSVLIPYPYAADDHQNANADALVTRGAAVKILESELGPNTLAKAIIELLSSPRTLRRMARCAAAFTAQDPAEAIASRIERLAA